MNSTTPTTPRLFLNDQGRFTRQIEVVPLPSWLDWASGRDSSLFIALPMIQRGSVWSGGKVVELWDSLLRGMPVGCLTVSVFEDEEVSLVRKLGSKEAKKSVMPAGSLALLDGQQRTLSLLLGWLKMPESDRRLWVDFGSDGQTGHDFCLRMTTQFHPFGFQPNNQSNKLERWQKRAAREDFDLHHPETEALPDHRLPLDKTRPYGATGHLVLMPDLLELWRNSTDTTAWIEEVLKRCAGSEQNRRRIASFATCLERLMQMEIALVRVAPHLLAVPTEHGDDGSTADAGNDDDEIEPPLVTLFRRIANAGADLTAEDYAFSLIKHRFPEAHNLVQRLHQSGTISSLLTANELVMTAVRLAAAFHSTGDGKGLPDYPVPTSKDFNRLLRRANFLQEGLIPLLEGTENRLSLVAAFASMHHCIQYRPQAGEGERDAGFPLLSLPVLGRQLVQVLVFWAHRCLRSSPSEEAARALLEQHRPEILRLALFWTLCVHDQEKHQRKASQTAFAVMKHAELAGFPGLGIARELVAKELALPIEAAEIMKPMLWPVELSETQTPLPSHWRLRAPSGDGVQRPGAALANKFAHHRHILIWLQRASLHTNPDFKNLPILAGPEYQDSKPYDYDHIVPWADLCQHGNRNVSHFCRYVQDSAYVSIANSIGNLRVRESSANRRDSDQSPRIKLALRPEDETRKHDLLSLSQILPNEAEDWEQSSYEKIGDWSAERAVKFHQAVGRRAFRLYQEWFTDGGFRSWLEAMQPADSPSSPPP